MILLIILLAEFLNSSGQTGTSAFMHFEEEKTRFKATWAKEISLDNIIATDSKTVFKSRLHVSLS